MKIPISHQLATYLIAPCAVIAFVGLHDLYDTGSRRLDQNLLLIGVFGPPALLLGWSLLDKRVLFRENNKVRKAKRWFRLPATEFVVFMALLISFLFLLAGLATIAGDKHHATGWPALGFGAFLLFFSAMAIENDRIWFSNTVNAEDLAEEYTARGEETPAYQDGIFTYSEDGFTVQLTDNKRTVHWDEIVSIQTYKIDQWTVDCIVIEINLADTCLTINDETPGHMKFMSIAAQKLSNFKADWFVTVAFPAFATNYTTVYVKDAGGEKIDGTA